MNRKRSIDDLAAFGGPPEFHAPMHVGRPNLGDRQALLKRIEGVLDRRWFTNDGPLVREFEEKIAKYVGVRHCVAMTNGTVALEIAIRACGLKGEVLVPSFTFVATAHALQWQEITPRFVDLDPRTHNLDVKRLEERLTPHVTGVIGVHVWGRACDIEGLTRLAERRGLTLLFDAAHAFGASYRGKMIGGFGKAEVFSFHATKFLNSFEGGAIVTSDDELAERTRLMRNFGFAGYDNVSYLGTNGKMTEIAAAMGITSLESREEFIAANRERHDAYRAVLRELPGVTLVRYDRSEWANWQYVVLEIEPSLAGLSRDELTELLWRENVLARRYFFPGAHRMAPYRTMFPEASAELPRTEWLAERVMLLPTGTAITLDEVERVGRLIRFLLENGEAIRERWGAAS